PPTAGSGTSSSTSGPTWTPRALHRRRPLGPELKPSELIVQAVVVNIADRAARDPDTVVTVDDLRAFERRHGRIPRDSAVLMDSGWAAKVGDVTAYRGAPIEVEAPLHFPGFGAEATEWLLRHRRIR